jgi:Fe-S-cluster containining protein
MSNYCLETKCMQCCTETNMLLSYHDIEKIKKRGIDPLLFIVESDGWLHLKNSHGRCVFHDGDKCTIYEDRPEGCTLYPVVYDADNHHAVLDEECPQRHCFPLEKPRANQLVTLIATLKHERTQRRHSQKKKNGLRQ